MQSHKILFAAVLMGGFTLAGPVAAEPLRLAQSFPGALPPHEIVSIVRSSRLTPLDRPMRRGSNYVLRAVDPDGEEVRVVVDARMGDILSVTPILTAHADPAMPEELRPPGYVRARPMLPPGVYEGPPEVYEGREPMIYSPPPPRPSAGVPGAPSYGAPPYHQPPAVASAPLPPPGGAPPMRSGMLPPPVQAMGEPHVIMAPEVGRDGNLLPPPPERFPQRAPPPGAKPAKVKAKPAKSKAADTHAKPTHARPAPGKRTASAPSGSKPPLPKPRPPAGAKSEADAGPVPPPIPESKTAAERRSAADNVPH